MDMPKRTFTSGGAAKSQFLWLGETKEWMMLKIRGGHLFNELVCLLARTLIELHFANKAVFKVLL